MVSEMAGAGNTALPLDGSVVKMKGLPFKATTEDVTKFYQGFTLKADNIYLKRHPDGRPNGEAFVVFESPDEARRACQKDRETFGDKFGDRYVRVYPTLESDVSDMQAAVLQQNMVQQQGSHSHIHMDSVVKMKSLPFDATQLDIIQFFESFRLKPNGVQLVVRSDNKPTGEAFVDFENFEEAAKAIREKDHKVFHEKFGDRYVRLIQVSRKEMQATLALRFGGEGILKVKGIPFKASAADVRKFFSGYKIKPDGVSFIMHADGRPTGMAFIEFETPQEAVRAMEKDRAKFGPEYGDRFCMLQLVGRHEMEKVTLQRESDAANHKLMNGMNGLNAAAMALQAALGNPALQPLLMAQNPWLASHMLGMGIGGPPGPNGSNGHMQPLQQLGQVATTGPGGVPPMDHLAAAQFGQQLNGHMNMGSMNTALNGLNLLPQQQQQQQQHNGHSPHHSQPQQQAPNGGMQQQPPQGDQGGWMPNAQQDNVMNFYANGSNGAADRSWGADPRLGLSGLQNQGSLGAPNMPPQSLGLAPSKQPQHQQQLIPQLSVPNSLGARGQSLGNGGLSSGAHLGPSSSPSQLASSLSASLSLPTSTDGSLDPPHSFSNGGDSLSMGGGQNSHVRQ